LSSWTLNVATFVGVAQMVSARRGVYSYPSRSLVRFQSPAQLYLLVQLDVKRSITTPR